MKPNLEKRAEKWAVKKMHARPDRALFNILAIVELEKRAWLAGYKAGRKEQLKSWESYGAYIRVSDSRQEENAGSQVTETRAPACPKRRRR